ncbi:hypothetical protein [Oxalicibacterium solurbis]|nr:hypothetical protein [Oxalicibacterium solurbis]
MLSLSKGEISGLSHIHSNYSWYPKMKLDLYLCSPYTAMHQQGKLIQGKEIIMSTLSKTRVSAYALNSQANRIAQTNPELAAALRMQAAYGSQLPVASKVSTKKETAQVKKSVQLLNSKANSIAQTQPERAIALRMQAAFA